MVSLGSEGSTGGGFFFGRDLPESAEDSTDDCSLVSSHLITEAEPRHKRFPVSGWISVGAHFVFINVMLGLLFADLVCPILCMLHSGLWCIFFITSCVLHHCNGVMKRYGYLEFYRKIRLYIKVPFVIVSFGNAAVLVSVAALQRFCPSSVTCPEDSIMKCRDYVLIIFSLEYILQLLALIKCSSILIKFHRQKALPDVHQDELLISCIHSQSQPHEIGIRDGDYKEEILESQADMIRYLRQHNIYLSRKILQLTCELEAFKVDPRT